VVKVKKHKAVKFGGKRLLTHWIAVVIVLLAVPAFASASTLISETYSASDKMQSGTIVSLKKNTSDKVEAASTANTAYILGIVIDSDNSQLSISNNENNQVHVATNGIEPVLVSDINGAIAVGDSITASPITGVGMKATDNVKVVGVAQEAFPNGSASKASITDKKTKQKQDVKLGQISALVNVAYYYKQPEKTIIPSAIQNVANALAGKKVNSLPIIVSIGIFIMAMIVVVSIVFSLIRNSIISVGRNPMAQSAVYRNVIQLSLLVIIILGVAVGAIFMILTKL
jgi:hypothetical protein